MAEKSELNLKMNFDCEDAIKGLKAFRRELNDTLKDVKELQAVMDDSEADPSIAKAIGTVKRPDGYEIVNAGDTVPAFKFYKDGLSIQFDQDSAIKANDELRMEGIDYIVFYTVYKSNGLIYATLYELDRIKMANRYIEGKSMTELEFNDSIGNIEWIEYKK